MNPNTINSSKWWISQPTKKWLNLSDIPQLMFKSIWSFIELENVILHKSKPKYRITHHVPFKNN